MAKHTDTERLEFLIENEGVLSSNAGSGFIYWFANHTRTAIVPGRTAREAIDAAIEGERG